MPALTLPRLVKALWSIEVILLVACFTLYGVATLLPPTFQAERTAVIAAAPAQVWPQISRPTRWRSWVPWLADDAALVLTPTAAATGAGAGLTWQSARQGSGSLSFTRSDSAAGRVDFTLAFDGWPPMQGSLQLEAQHGRTHIRWTMEGTAQPPLKRLLALRADAMLGPDLEQGLISLARLAAPAQP